MPRLDTSVEVWRKSAGRDALNAPSQGWARVATIWAHVAFDGAESLTGVERVASHRVTVTGRAIDFDVRPRDQLRAGGVSYAVVAVTVTRGVATIQAEGRAE